VLIRQKYIEECRFPEQWILFKAVIFHDYIEAIGRGERLALMLARTLSADIITTDLSQEAVQMHSPGFYWLF
jgi:hypothetical protein